MANKILHTQDTYGLRPEAQSFPMMLVLSFVYPCNALCPHCPYTNSNIRKEYKDAPFMSEAIFKKIADEAGPHGSYLRISGGGEPMLHPQAVELLVYAKQRGCKIGLITNGSLFDEESSRQLLSAGVDMIEFSVDSSEPYTYGIVRKGLDWETLNLNVERMVALRDELDSPTKIIASAVNQEGINLDEVESYWVKNKGIDYLIRRKFLTWGTNTELDDSRSADITAYLEGGEVPCPFIFERLNIDSRGNTMVCGYDISANTSMGNVATESISDIWHGPGFTWYREKHLAGKGMEVPLCKGCPDWKYRSWTHNYWKVIEKSEEVLQVKRSRLGVHDDFQSVTED